MNGQTALNWQLITIAWDIKLIIIFNNMYNYCESATFRDVVFLVKATRALFLERVIMNVAAVPLISRVLITVEVLNYDNTRRKRRRYQCALISADINAHWLIYTFTDKASKLSSLLSTSEKISNVLIENDFQKLSMCIFHEVINYFTIKLATIA